MILPGQGWVLLRGWLSVMPSFVSRSHLHLRIPWRSVPTRTAMTHMLLFSSRFLNLPWRIELGIQWYLWQLPQIFSSLVRAKTWLVWWLVWSQPRRAVFASGWIRPERHRFQVQLISGTYTIHTKRECAWIWFHPRYFGLLSDFSTNQIKESITLGTSDSRK